MGEIRALCQTHRSTVSGGYLTRVFVKLVVLALEKERGPSMQITLRIARQQLSLRALLLIAGAALMIVVGLLGMHAFSADVAGRGCQIVCVRGGAPD